MKYIDPSLAIVCRNDLEVTSEDAVYDLLVKWVHTQYPNLEERHEIFSHQLVRLIRFPLNKLQEAA